MHESQNLKAWKYLLERWCFALFSLASAFTWARWASSVCLFYDAVFFLCLLCSYNHSQCETLPVTTKGYSWKVRTPELIPVRDGCVVTRRGHSTNGNLGKFIFAHFRALSVNYTGKVRPCWLMLHRRALICKIHVLLAVYKPCAWSLCMSLDESSLVVYSKLKLSTLANFS